MNNEQILKICIEANSMEEAIVNLLKEGMAYPEAKKEVFDFYNRKERERNAEYNCMVNV